MPSNYAVHLKERNLYADPVSSQRAKAVVGGGQRKGVPPEISDKLRKLLFALETAETLDQLRRFPGWKLHPLKGDLKGCWSLTVTGNWRLIFTYDERANSAGDVDLVDYH